MKTDSENMKKFKHLVVLPLYIYLFARKWLFAFNKVVFTLSLRGIGILNNENDAISGENWFLEQISELLENSTVFGRCKYWELLRQDKIVCSYS